MTQSLLGTDVEPSRICLGSALFGSEISRDRTFALLDAYVEAGGNFVDTAHIYAAWLENGVGASERTIGEWLRTRGVRDSIVLATKGAHPPIDAEEKIGRCAKGQLEQDLSESLERLGLDCVDLYWLHFDEPTRPVGEIIEGLAELLRGGRIRSYGASNWATERIEAANTYAAEHGLPPFVASEPWWSLGAAAGGPQAGTPTSQDADPLRAWHVSTGLPMIPYSSQANGYFGAENAAWARDGFSGAAPRAEGFDSPANRRRLLHTMELAEETGVTANQIALGYLLSQPFPVFPIIGTGSLEHLRDAMGAIAVRLSEEECAGLFG
jgi:aryl-alcohol dehydrogenase-like predicted oxidoreductase